MSVEFPTDLMLAFLQMQDQIAKFKQREAAKHNLSARKDNNLDAVPTFLNGRSLRDYQVRPASVAPPYKRCSAWEVYRLCCLLMKNWNKALAVHPLGDLVDHRKAFCKPDIPLQDSTGNVCRLACILLEH